VLDVPYRQERFRGDLRRFLAVLSVFLRYFVPVAT